MCSDIQPLYRHRVLNNLAGLNCDGNKWAKEWISIGFDALEKELAIYAKKYCVGDQLTLADVCLVPLVYEAYR
jgi:glutathione S-transferase